MRWLEDVEKAVDKEQGASIIKKAKALTGPHSQEVNK